MSSFRPDVMPRPFVVREDLDCSQGYHRLWVPDCSGRKTE